MDHGGSERRQVTETKPEVCQFKVRLQQPLKAWLQQQAATAKRSLTAEIELRLEKSRAQQQKGQQE
jgi:hypothetical protein